MPTQRLDSLDQLSFDFVLSDLDGVVYRGEEPLPGVVRRFGQWQAAGLPYCFVTNNAEKSPAEFARKIEGFGIACPPGHVVTSAEVALAYAQEHYAIGRRAYVIGSASLKQRVEAAGFVLAETDASFVLVALDRAFDYAMLAIAQRNILAGAALIGTNPDVIRPVAGGFEPGTGAIVEAVAAASLVSPRILGKPSAAILHLAMARIHAAPERTIMLGDQLDTDILAARNAGLRGVLLETGVPARSALGVTADYVLDRL